MRIRTVLYEYTYIQYYIMYYHSCYNNLKKGRTLNKLKYLDRKEKFVALEAEERSEVRWCYVRYMTAHNDDRQRPLT